MKASQTVIGKSATLGIALEVVILFFGPWFLHTLGIYWMLILSMTAMVLRGWFYVFIRQRSSLSGQSTALSCSRASPLALPSRPVSSSATSRAEAWAATAQALYTSIYSQLPAVLVAFAGGRIYASLGYRPLFSRTQSSPPLVSLLFLVKYTLDGSIRIAGSAVVIQHTVPHKSTSRNLCTLFKDPFY